VLIVGRVVALREHLRWFDSRPLFGKRVLVTRPRDQSAELVERLEAMGAEAIEAPMIRIEPPDNFEALDAACARADTFDWIVFSSINGVDAFIGRLLLSPFDLRALGHAKLCGVGSATSERLARHGLKLDVMPSEYRAEALIHALTQTGELAGKKILLPHADVGREVIADELRKHGAQVVEVVVSDRGHRSRARRTSRTCRMLLEGRIDIVTFTSPSAVRNMVSVLGAEPAVDLLRKTIVAAIGPVTAEAATRSGIETSVIPDKYTVPALVAAIVKFVESTPESPEPRVSSHQSRAIL
jgi:uroporphyrinogen III methyltransferase/synthase